MNPDTVLDRIIQANPKPASAETPGNILTRSALLDELDRRSGNMQTQDKPIIVKPERRRRLGPALVGALSVIIAIVVAVALLSGDNEPDEQDVVNQSPVTTATPVTTQPPTTTTASAFTVDEALAVTDAYFEAYNAGDVEAVLALFEPDATFFNDPFGWQTRADWEQLLVWNAAQGTTLSPPECTVTAEVPGVSVTVSCPHSNLDVLVQAVDGPPVPINLGLIVTPDGIRNWVSSFGQPDFNTVGIPFEGWMQRNHPEDVSAVGFGNWSSVEEAEQNGVLTAQYADEWAAFLEGNGCNYRDDC